jgi:hypothetical protein
MAVFLVLFYNQQIATIFFVQIFTVEWLRGIRICVNCAGSRKKLTDIFRGVILHSFSFVRAVLNNSLDKVAKFLYSFSFVTTFPTLSANKIFTFSCAICAKI